jgi:hypothetical protein
MKAVRVSALPFTERVDGHRISARPALGDVKGTRPNAINLLPRPVFI